MANDIIKRDQNFMTVGAGVNNSDTTDVRMLKVNPSTDYILVSVSDLGAPTGSAASIAKRDQNFRTVAMGWDATNSILKEILVDANGVILCKVV